jgi:hypothetical protein
MYAIMIALSAVLVSKRDIEKKSFHHAINDEIISSI